MSVEPNTAPAENAKSWARRTPYTWRTLITIIVLLAFLGYTAPRVGIPTFFANMAELGGSILGLNEDSQVGNGFATFFEDMFPLAISRETPVSRIQGFDADHIPWFARLEERQVTERVIDPTSLEISTEAKTVQMLVEPAGYLFFVIGKLVETLEIAIWATLVATLISIPLAYYSAKNYSPNRWVYHAARSVVAALRSTPELISALVLVLAFGFGPLAGVLALSLHSAGFLGKFFAEDIEGADDQPQAAMRAIGASKLKTLRLAVLPEVLPNYTALTLYILDRNVRMAAVIGLVGGGGIGQELKGRYDLFQYDHVGTILVALFATILLLDQCAARIRRNLI